MNEKLKSSLKNADSKDIIDGIFELELRELSKEEGIILIINNIFYLLIKRIFIYLLQDKINLKFEYLQPDLNFKYVQPPSLNLGMYRSRSAELLSELSSNTQDTLISSPHILKLKDYINMKFEKFIYTFSDKRFHKELLRFVLALILLVPTVIAMTTSQIFSDQWYSKNTNSGIYATQPLYDRFLLSFPDWTSEQGWLSDLLLNAFIAISFLFGIFLPVNPVLYQGFIAGRRICWILIMTYILRAFSFLVTTVPSPNPDCVVRYSTNMSNNIEVLGAMMGGKITACTDNIFSGHTTLAMTFLYTAYTFSGRPIFNLFLVFHFICVIIAILFTRLHYTIDILIALFLVTFINAIYNLLLHCAVELLIINNVNKTIDEEGVNILINQMEDQHENGENESNVNIELLKRDKDDFLKLSIIRKFSNIVGWFDGIDLRYSTQT
jgi:hypothetical protein